MKKAEDLIKDISEGKNLSFEESKVIFLSIMSGNIKEDLIYKFLTNLSSKGETADEIAGGVYVLRAKALKVSSQEKIIDRKTISKDLIITAETQDKIIMAVMHKKYNIHGVQFHPESIKTIEGMKLLKNFLNYK